MTDSADGPVFRASKRRKIFRKRPDDDDDAPQVKLKVDENDEDEEKRENAALKQRRLMGARKGGVAFSSHETRRHVKSSLETQHTYNTHEASTSTSSNAPAPQDAIEHAQARFVAPTGHITSTDDKHMMAYVDSKLARLHSSTPTPNATSNETPLLSRNQQPKDPPPHLQYAAYRNLEEVDLAPENNPTHTNNPDHISNILARPNKPPRSRRHHPARRNSADLARDAMVDQVLRESRLDMYDDSHTSAPPVHTRPGHNEDADERMAEEFKRNFYAQAQEKSVRRTAPPPAGGAGSKQPVQTLKGPKLGGSRSQRAQMHANAKAEAEKK